MRRSIISEDINFPFTLAPMVGLSHIALRLLVREYLPSNAKTIWPTEMLNSRRLVVQSLGETPETLKEINEDYLVPQILGNEEDFIQGSVIRLKEWGAKGIDINMGCPVRKALRHNYGVALMGDPKYASEIVRMTTRHTDLPVSVKLRAGLQKDSKVLINTVQGLEEAGASWICLHPRTAEQKRRGNSDWEQIKLLRENISIPVIGNGDVQVYQDALDMIEQTKCDAVMIGRALTAKPWIFWQLGNHMGLDSPPGKEGQRPPETPEEEAKEYGKCLLKMIEYCIKYFNEKDAQKKIRFYIKVSHVWLNYGHRLNSIAHKAKTFEELKEEITKFFESSGLSMSSRSDLRY